MTKRQRVIIGIGVIIILAMCVYPPYEGENLGVFVSGGETYYSSRSGGYALIWANNNIRATSVDVGRLAVQVFAVALLDAAVLFLWKPRHGAGLNGTTG